MKFCLLLSVFCLQIIITYCFKQVSYKSNFNSTTQLLIDTWILAVTYEHNDYVFLKLNYATLRYLV